MHGVEPLGLERLARVLHALRNRHLRLERVAHCTLDREFCIARGANVGINRVNQFVLFREPLLEPFHISGR